ncbi:MAG: hypothetical protein EP297_14065, partial [Gammaproteobacteria bacterium]
MTIQFSIISYIIIAVFYLLSAGVLAMLWQVLRFLPGSKIVFWVLATVVTALPWADEVWIAYHFNDACKDAGIHVKRQVVVDGFYKASTNDPSDENKIIDEPERFQRYVNEGFRYKEVRTREGKVRHREVKDGIIEQTILDKPESRYHLVHTHNHTKIGYQLKKHEMVVFDSQLNQVIGRDTSYARYPALVDRLWIS